MSNAKVARELVKLAKELQAGLIGHTYVLTRDARTKKAEFGRGEKLRLEEYSTVKGLWTVRLKADDGRRLSLLVVTAHKKLRGFPKPPSIAQMKRWMADGVARAVDGACVEPDGTSPDNAPSWMLVMHVI